MNYGINLGNIPFDNMQFKQHLAVSGLCSHCMAGGIEALPASSSRRSKTIYPLRDNWSRQHASYRNLARREHASCLQVGLFHFAIRRPVLRASSICEVCCKKHLLCSSAHAPFVYIWHWSCWWSLSWKILLIYRSVISIFSILFSVSPNTLLILLW